MAQGHRPGTKTEARQRPPSIVIHQVGRKPGRPNESPSPRLSSIRTRTTVPTLDGNRRPLLLETFLQPNYTERKDDSKQTEPYAQPSIQTRNRMYRVLSSHTKTKKSKNQIESAYRVLFAIDNSIIQADVFREQLP